MKSFMVKNTRKSDLIMFSELAGLEKFDQVLLIFHFELLYQLL